MNLLIQFLLRLSFGLAAGMAITSSKKVTSGYFRNHLYVTLGLTTLAAMVSITAMPPVLVFWCCVGAAVASYAGSVCWLYERSLAGKVMLLTVASISFAGCFFLTAHTNITRTREVRTLSILQEVSGLSAKYSETLNKRTNQIGSAPKVLNVATIVTSGFLLGMTMAAMLLGHWYLNTPTMELVPLRRLIIAMSVAVGMQAVVSALGLWGEVTYANEITTQWWLFLLLRWLFGIIGVAILAGMAWQTLKIPNTQSATGILYVAVIGTFVGETMALLLSAESLFPL